MSHNLPSWFHSDPPARYVMYPTAAQPLQAPPNVTLADDFTTHLAEGGFPDLSEANAGVAFARAQRAASRDGESRTALTGPTAHQAAVASAGGAPARVRTASGFPAGSYAGAAPTFYGDGWPGGVGPEPTDPATGDHRIVVDNRGDKKILKAERRQNRLLRRLLKRERRDHRKATR